MGCGCNKGKLAAVAATNRQTVYQVVDSSNQSIVAEFSTLPEARSKAVEISGRVRVTNRPL